MGRGWMVAAAVVLAACGGIKQEEERQKDLGQQTADVTSDTRALEDASAAVNELLRVQDDCEAARPLIPKANAALDTAAGRVRTATGRTTLDGLKNQVRTIASACGG